MPSLQEIAQAKEKELREANKGMTVASQVKAAAAVTSVSQSSANKPLEDQLQSTVKVESVPKSEVPYYELNEDEILRDASLVARPFVLDESYKIKAKDPHYAFRWVEYKAQEGFYFNKASVLGFEPAHPDDLIEHRGTVKENKIFIGDVILMKMAKNHYAGLIKRNLLASNAMISSKNAIRQAKSLAGTVVTGIGRQPTMERDKAEFFEPSQKDLVIKDAQDREVGSVHDLRDSAFETLKR